MQLENYLRGRVNAPIEIQQLQRLSGGASHDTWAFEVRCNGRAEDQCYVLRRDFEQGLLEGSLAAEFSLLSSLRDRGLPVATPFWYEDAGSCLGQPFMITERVPGTDLRKALARHGATLDRRTIGLKLVALQARIHSLTSDALGPQSVGNASGSAQEQVDRWARAFEQDGARTPLIGAAIAWLRSNLPQQEQPCLLHGDFKANNILFSDDGSATVLDWELCHVGDPLEDLAWTLLWRTQWDLVGGLLSEEAYLQAYTQLSGRTIPENRLFFWRVFAWLKLAAIFQRGSGMAAQRPALMMLCRALPYIEREIGRLLAQDIRKKVTR